MYICVYMHNICIICMVYMYSMHICIYNIYITYMRVYVLCMDTLCIYT